MTATPSFGSYALGPRAARYLRWAQAMPVGWLGRRGALLMRRLALKDRPAMVDATVEGLKMRLHMQDNVSERKFLFMPQFFDRHERSLLRARLKNGDVFVDIGANAGIYTLTGAALVGGGGRVLSVEPNPAVLPRLRYNLSLNGFEGRVTIEQCCVSDAEGTVNLALDDTNLGGSSLVAARSGHAISVPALPLLAILRKNGIEKIDALKIDIEGAEDKALIPFFRDAPLALHPALLIVENSEKDWRQDLPAALKAAGYALRETTRMNLIFEK